jgi:thymidine phosphorylase
MSEALERLRASRRADVTLPSGLEVTIQLLRVQDFIAAGDVPMPVLESIRAKASTNGDVNEKDVLEALTTEDLRHSMQFNDTIVRLTVVAIEGETVQLSEDDVKLLDAEDCTEVVAYAMRTKALPGKAA